MSLSNRGLDLTMSILRHAQDDTRAKNDIVFLV